jgi:hypothetical protein
MASNNEDIVLKWHVVGGHDDPRWSYTCCLYAYLAPRRAEILYIGKCDGKSVRQRWNACDKRDVWKHINQFARSHRLIVAEIYLADGDRLTRRLLADIESLLISSVQPTANIQAKRLRISRPGLVVRCHRDWPLSAKTFKDD